MSKKQVYTFEFDLGRGYEGSGLFVATQAEVNDAIGRTAHFGEICGKHSEVSLDLEQSQFKVVSEDPIVVSFVDTALCGELGLNPLEYVMCEDCSEYWPDCEC